MAQRGRPKGTTGNRKTGGRKKGTPNRVTQDVIKRLQELDFSPLDELVSLYRDPQATIDIKVNIARDLAQYVYPKRKAIDHTSQGERLTVIISGDDAKL